MGDDTRGERLRDRGPGILSHLMRRPSLVRRTLVVLPSLFVFCLAGPRAAAQAPSVSTYPTPTRSLVSAHATGSFDVTLTPAEPPDIADGSTLARMANVKRFHGDLDATSVGTMLAATGTVPNSAAYVLVERVTGTLAGRRGSFVLMHSATMNRGVPQQSIVVVPDSGSGDLAGLAGTLTIDVTGGQHRYDLTYTLPATP